MMKIRIKGLYTADTCPLPTQREERDANLSLEPAAVFHLDFIFSAIVFISGISF